MNNAHYQQKQGRQSKNKPEKAEKPANGLTSFWPTEAERKVLASDQRSLVDLIEALQEHVERGLTFKIGIAKDKSSLYITCRDGEAGFGEGFGISVFHSSLPRAILAMVYCLDVKWPEFPEKPPFSEQRSYDW